MIQRLRGVRFNWRNGGQRDVGLVAEEVGQVVPEIVTYERDGQNAQSLDYNRLVPVLIQGMKEQQSTIQEQQKQISEHQSTIQQLREDDEKLQERIGTLERTVKQFAQVN
jgi:predicted RNase H-like nuclease (RuvC/YqgF family)